MIDFQPGDTVQLLAPRRAVTGSRVERSYLAGDRFRIIRLIVRVPGAAPAYLVTEAGGSAQLLVLPGDALKRVTRRVSEVPA